MSGKCINRTVGATMFALIWIVCGCMAAGSSALPRGRHYEMVSPPYKGGYAVQELHSVAMASDAEGDRVQFESVGTFAGAPNNETINSYLARRSASGWSTEALMMPSTRTLPRGEAAVDISPSLGSALFLGFPGEYASTTSRRSFEPSEREYFVRRLDAAGTPFEAVGQALARLDGGPLDITYVTGSSPDLCHVLFEVGFSSNDKEHEALLEEGQGTDSWLYEISAGNSVLGCGTEPAALRLVGVGNELGVHGEPKPVNPYCRTHLGGPGGSNFNSVAAQGHEIFFTTSIRAEPGCDESVGGHVPSNPFVLYVRLNGEHTLLVSTPIEADCQEGALCYEAIAQGAGFRGQKRVMFEGSNEDGTRVFFRTRQPLVSGDSAPDSNDLYMAKIGCPSERPCAWAEREVTSLVQVSSSPIAGEAADVVNEEHSVVSPNGERIYFVAHGVLTQGTNREGRRAVKGADNLYVYDAANETLHFVVALCSSAGLSGEASDPSCPGGEDSLTSPEALEAQTTGNGEFLLFTSYGRLVHGDTDARRDIYRYDAGAETLERVSTGEDGFDGNGNNDGYDAELPPLNTGPRTREGYEMGYRAISEDGSRIVFGTADPLSPKAINGLVNAYEWHSGEVSLVSSGSDEEPVGTRGKPAVITPSGRDIFFMTAQGLLSQDNDGAYDVYDAREGVGFPAEPAPREACSGDACQGPLSNLAPLLVPGSASQAPGENATPAAAARGKAASASKPKGRCRRAHPRSKRPGRCAKARMSGHRSKSRSIQSRVSKGGGRS